MKTKLIYTLIISVVLLLSYNCNPPENNENMTKTTSSKAWLKVSGNKIVNQDNDTILLRGFGLGGMLHMENFINGFPANEEAVLAFLDKKIKFLVP